MTGMRLICKISLSLLILTFLASLPDPNRQNPLQAYAQGTILRPTDYTDYTGTVINPQFAYQKDECGEIPPEECCAEISTSQDAFPAIEYSGWGESGTSYSSLRIKVKRSASGRDDTWSIKYSPNGGGNWYPLDGPLSDANDETIGMEMDPSALRQLRIRIDTDKVKNADNASLRIYDIYAEGVVPDPPESLLLTQSEYAFFENVDSLDLSAITSNAPGTDEATAIAIDDDDVSVGYMYVAGFEPGKWRIEKRTKFQGSLEYTVTSDCSGQPNAIIVADPFMYVVGDEYADGNDAWRIEKRRLENGVLVEEFGVGGVVRNNPSDNDDSAQAAAIIGEYLYIAGSDRSNGLSDAQWRIEKRSLEDGSLDQVEISNPSNDNDVPLAIAVYPDHPDYEGENVIYLAGYDRAAGSVTTRGKKSKTESNAEFRIEARYAADLSLILDETSNPTPNHDVIYALAIQPRTDADAGALFLAGSQEMGFFDTDWRIEKRSLVDLSLKLFPTTDEVDVDEPWIITEDFGYDDKPQAMAIDENYLYIAGHAAPVNGGGDTGWRIEKINLFDGDLEYEIDNDPYPSDNDRARAIAVDSERMYVAGYDNPGLPGWRMEIRNIGDGSSVLLEQRLIGIGDGPVLLAPGEKFRLRMLVGVERGTLPLAGQRFKLQVDGYDINGDTPIVFWDNPTLVDGDMIPSSLEPKPLDDYEVLPQTYVESNVFTNSVSGVEEGNYAMWDFSLRVNDTAASGDYEISIVKENGDPLDGSGAPLKIDSSKD